MIIYTNEGNPHGLKLLILAKVAKREVTVKTVNLNDPLINEIKQLPILELDSGTQIFSTNAAAKYLLPKETNNAIQEEWLEWSSTLLAPALAHNMGVGHRADPNARPMLNRLIKKLDDTLQQTPFLTGSSPAPVDYSVWSLLAPDGTLKGAASVENVLVWFRKLAETSEIKSALKQLPLKKLTFSSLQQSNQFGGLHHIVLASAGDESPNILPESPSHIIETVTNEELETAKVNFVPIPVREIKEAKTVLPKKGERNILITSALPYVNNVPHLGNIVGSTLSSDIFARYSRLCGYNTLFVCGTDEYGTATENKALAEKLTPQQICDKYFEIHNAIYCWFNIGFDYFGRTSTKEQTEITQDIFTRIHQAGYIETQSVEQLLCQQCDRFLADRFVEGTCPHPGCGYEDARGDQCDKCGKLVNATELIRPRCKVCNSAPVLRNSDQLFLNLPKVEPKLRQWIEKVENGWTNNARVITRSWLKEGLKSRCITRDLKWGIPVPLKGFENKVFYVWFDAPIGYISITSRYTKEYKQWWNPDKDVDISLYQFMGKDNVPFHSVMFPSTLLALDNGSTLASHIMATEYLNYEDGKFSKSRGIGVFGNDAQETGIPADIWRFYLASARPEGQDSSFSWNDLAARNNSELLNNLGNFVNRSLMFCEKNFASTVPPMKLTDEELLLLALVNREIKGYVTSMEKAKFRDGIRHILSISRHGNQYMQSQQPWVLFKGTDDQKARAGTITGVLCNLSALLALLVFPYMPNIARNLYTQLESKHRYIDPSKPFAATLLPAGHKIGKPVPLFTKIEQSRIDELRKKYAGTQSDSTSSKEQGKPADEQKGFASISEAEEAVKVQGEKVRALKSSGADKSVWQPEVAILLEYKKKLEALQKNPSTEAVPNQLQKKDAIKALEKRVADQANKVRLLKGSSGPDVWKPEVEILLTLKKELATLTGASEPKTGKNKKKS